MKYNLWWGSRIMALFLPKITCRTLLLIINWMSDKLCDKSNVSKVDVAKSP